MKILFKISKQIVSGHPFKEIFRKSLISQIYCRSSSSNSSYWNKINFSQFKNYLKFLQKLNNDLNEHSNFVWPQTLLQELGPNQSQAKSRLSFLANYGENVENIGQSLEVADEFSKEIDVNDKAMLSDIEHEKENLKEELNEALIEALEYLTNTSRSNNFMGVHLKIEPGVGGNESALFAAQLYEMYQTLCHNHGLEIEEREYLTSENGVFIKVSAYIQNNGEPELGWLIHEGGTHRVQRVPETEAHGRLHTSTVSIGVIPEYKSHFKPLEKKDLKIIFGKSSKPGGQNVNKRLTKAIITHLPTKLQASCEDSRNAIQNKENALARLTELVHSRTIIEKNTAMDNSKKAQMSHRNRSDKIRTYNFPNDRITDHRICLSVHGIHSVLTAGKQLETLLQSVENHFLFLDKIDIVNVLIKEANEFIKN